MPIDSYIDIKKKEKTGVLSNQISEDEALKMQYNLLSNWTPQSDIWWIKWGRAVLSSSTIVSSLMIMNHYRRKLKLMSYGHPITFVPSVLMPALGSPIMHQEAVLNPIFLHPQCAVCIQLRSAFIHSFFGVVYPVIASSVSSFYAAYAFGTYHLPGVSVANLGQYFNIWKTITKPVYNVLPFHIAFQAMVAFIVTEFEAKAFFTVQEQLSQKMKSSNPSIKMLEK